MQFRQRLNAAATVQQGAPAARRCVSALLRWYLGKGLSEVGRSNQGVQVSRAGAPPSRLRISPAREEGRPQEQGSLVVLNPGAVLKSLPQCSKSPELVPSSDHCQSVSGGGAQEPQLQKISTDILIRSGHQDLRLNKHSPGCLPS